MTEITQAASAMTARSPERIVTTLLELVHAVAEAARNDREVVAFTPAVKAQQQRMGSRSGYARMEQNGGWNNRRTRRQHRK